MLGVFWSHPSRGSRPLPSLVSQPFELKGLICCSAHISHDEPPQSPSSALQPDSEHEIAHLNRETQSTTPVGCSSQSSTKLPRSPRHHPVTILPQIEFTGGIDQRNPPEQGSEGPQNDMSLTDCTCAHRRKKSEKLSPAILWQANTSNGQYMLSLPRGFDSLDERSDRSVSHQCRPTSLSGQTRPSKGAATETTWWKYFCCDGHVADTSSRHRTQETFRG